MRDRKSASPGANASAHSHDQNRRQFLKSLALGTALAPLASASRGLLTGQASPAPTLDTSLCYGTPGLQVPLNYQGCFRLFAADGSSTRLAFSNAALTGRVVGGDIHLFVAGASPGFGDPIYEVKYVGVGPTTATAPRAPLVRNWGDVFQGRRITGLAGGQVDLRGLLWADDMLLWAYGDTYNVAGRHDPSIGASVLNADGSVQAYGPWRTSSPSQKTRGYMIRHPGTGQVGYGAPVTSGNASSPWGACVHVGPKPQLGWAPDPTSGSGASIPTSALIDHGFGNRQRRFDTNYKFCGWNVQYDASQGAWTNPGTDQFTSIDAISAAAWVQTPSHSGIVCFGQMVKTIAGHDYGAGETQTHHWYGPHICPHGQDAGGIQVSVGDAAATVALTAWIFDPGNPGADPEPVSISALIPGHSERADRPYQFGGAWFEPSNRLLFVSERGVDPTVSPYEAQPLIHVFAV